MMTTINYWLDTTEPRRLYEVPDERLDPLDYYHRLLRITETSLCVLTIASSCMSLYMLTSTFTVSSDASFGVKSRVALSVVSAGVSYVSSGVQSVTAVGIGVIEHIKRYR